MWSSILEPSGFRGPAVLLVGAPSLNLDREQAVDFGRGYDCAVPDFGYSDLTLFDQVVKT